MGSKRREKRMPARKQGEKRCKTRKERRKRNKRGKEIMNEETSEGRKQS